MSPSVRQPSSLVIDGGLLGVVVVLERPAAGEVHDARPRRAAARSPSSPTMWHSSSGPADRAGVGQPLLGGDVGAADALGARVVLVDDRAPPLDHLALDRDRARRGGVDRRPAGSTGRSASRSSSGRRSMRTNIVGTNWAWVTRWCSMSSRHCCGVELLHHDDGAAEAVHRHGVHERRGVVERRGGEVHGARADAVHRRCPARSAPAPPTGSPNGVPGQRLAHALGPAGGARRVEHLPALPLVVERAGVARRRAPRRSARSPARSPTARHPHRRPGTRSRPATTSAIAADDTSATGPAVVEDVLHLGRRAGGC